MGVVTLHGGLALCLILYIAVLVTAGRAYARNDFKGVNIFTLTRYVPLGEYDAQRRLIGMRYQDHLDNMRILQDKERKTLYALVFLVAEVVVMAVLWIVVEIFGK